MKNIINYLILVVALFSTTPMLAQDDDCAPLTDYGSEPYMLFKKADFVDVTGGIRFFEGKLRCGDDITVFTDASKNFFYVANAFCKVKKGEIIYYTDLSGTSAPGEIDENNCTITIDGFWKVATCYFDSEPVPFSNSVGSQSGRANLKYYKASGEVTPIFNEDFFVGNVGNSMWVMVYDDIYPYVMFSASASSSSDKLKDLDPLALPYNITYAFSVQHIGLFKSFELYPSDGIHTTFADWVKAQAFSAASSPAEVIYRLSNDIACHAVDSYNQTINLDCPQFAWSVDLEKGTATYTPYFAPKQGASYQLSGDPQLCNIVESAATNKTVLLWGENAGGDVTDLADAAASKFSARGGSGSLTLSGVSESAFSLAGVKVLDAQADGSYTLAPGAYVVKSGSQAQLVTVR